MCGYIKRSWPTRVTRGHDRELRKTRKRSRAGVTVIEQMLVMTIMAIVLAVSFRTAAGWMHKAAVHSAARAAIDAFGAARDAAMTIGTRTAVRIDEAGGAIAVHAGADTVQRFPLNTLYGVQIEASRDSMAYSPSGLGWGASNLRLIIRRAFVAETITVSRLGRVR